MPPTWHPKSEAEFGAIVPPGVKSTEACLNGTLVHGMWFILVLQEFELRRAVVEMLSFDRSCYQLCVEAAAFTINATLARVLANFAATSAIDHVRIR
jgi:hypothetical protein